jgi:integrase
VSNFADKLDKFLWQKRALGYAYTGALQDFRAFDRMCAELFPDEAELTANICNVWAMRKGNEGDKTRQRRLPFIREFARYLIGTGERAYVLPASANRPTQRYIPHIYSRSEISALWGAFDRIRPTETYPAAHLVLPTLIRLLYCCGLRPSEALSLRANDVCLENGKLYIAESKGHKDRIVMLADDVRQLCCDYSRQVCEILPARRFFFANHLGEACPTRWLNWIFCGVRETLQIQTATKHPPRLYDLRHTFATHRLYQWMREGKDLYAMLPYLSSYMGHSSLSHTYYYIHLIPGMFEAMSGFRYDSATAIFPEAVNVDE